MKVSVIIPVYNTEKYLRKCLDSVINQTLKDIEIILVDDGSIDSSLDILREYEKKDSRVTVLSQQNKTAGAARQLGMTKAVGDYLVFWDSDDYFDLKSLEKMYKHAIKTNADVVVTSCYTVFKGYSETCRRGFLNMKLIPNNGIFNLSTNEDNILFFTTPSPWNKMFRREFIINSEITWQARPCCNDLYFVSLALCLAKTISTLDYPTVYYRRWTDSSESSSPSSRSVINTIDALIDLDTELRRRGLVLEKVMHNRALSSILFYLPKIRNYEEMTIAWNYLQSHLEVLHITPNTNRERDYFHISWHYDINEFIIQDSLEELLMFMLRRQSYDSDIMLTRYWQEAENTTNALKKLEEIQKSYSYKVGNSLSYIPRMINKLTSRKH